MADLLIADRDGSMHDPRDLADWLDVLGDRAGADMAELYHDAADVVRGLVVLAGTLRQLNDALVARGTFTATLPSDATLTCRVCKKTAEVRYTTSADHDSYYLVPDGWFVHVDGDYSEPIRPEAFCSHACFAQHPRFYQAAQRYSEIQDKLRSVAREESEAMRRQLVAAEQAAYDRRATEIDATMTKEFGADWRALVKGGV